MFKCENANRVQMQLQLDRECARPTDNGETAMTAQANCQDKCRPARLFGQNRSLQSALAMDAIGR